MMHFKKRVACVVVAVILVLLIRMIWSISANTRASKNLNDEMEENIRPSSPPKATSTKKRKDRQYFSQELMDDTINWGSDLAIPGPHINKSDGRLNVIVVPHFQVDTTIENQGNDLLDLLITKLTDWPDMTFIWPDTLSLYNWWMSKDDEKGTEMRSQLKSLVSDGRLEIVAGGWTVPDQTVTHYSSLLVQLHVAHEWLQKVLNVTPKAVWSVDPLGHSPVLPYFWSQSGYKWAVVQRISKRYKEFMASRHMLEFVWRQQWDKADKSDIFYHIHPYKLYSNPCGSTLEVCSSFDFKDLASVMNRGSEDSLISWMSKSLLDQLRQNAAHYRHNTVLLPVGDMSRDVSELEWGSFYTNLNHIIKYINNQREFDATIKYGTLNDYFTEINKHQALSELPVYSGDFLPYAEGYYDYWTGFYSSRPEQKRAIRELQEVFYAATVWESLSMTMSHRSNDLDEVERTLSLLQHNAAVTGASKATAAGDYRTKAQEALMLARNALIENIRRTMRSKADLQSDTEGIWKFYEFSELRPQLLSFSRRKKWHLIFMNSLTQSRYEVVSLVVDSHDLMVFNNYGTQIRSQIVSILEKDHIISARIFTIQFQIYMDPVSIAVYTITKSHDNSTSRELTTINMVNNYINSWPSDVFFKVESNRELRLSNDYIAAMFSPLNGSLLYVYLKDSDTKIKVTSELLAYKSSKNSSAYLFAPKGEASPLLSSPPSILSVSGNVSQSIEVKYPGVTLVYTLYNTEGPKAKVIQVTCQVDINIEELKNHELVLRFHTDIKNRGVLYTDSNGFQHIRRRYHGDRPIEGNYYPFTSSAAIQRDKMRFTLHASHSHGVASLQNGGLEVMLDRLPGSDGDGIPGGGITHSSAHVDMFYLHFEYFRLPTSEYNLNSIFLPTLESTLLGDFFLYPIYTIVSSSLHEQQTLKLLSEKIPADTIIVTMKLKLIASEENQRDLRVVLYRRGTANSESNTSPGSPINLWSVTGSMYIIKVTEMSLTFVEEKRSLKVGEVVYLPPMSLAAFEIHLLSI